MDNKLKVMIADANEDYGYYTVTATGIGNYENTATTNNVRTANFTVTKADLANAADRSGPA